MALKTVTRSIVLAKIDLVALYFCLLLIPQYLKRFNWSKTRQNKRNLKTKQWNPPSFRLFSLASMISRSFQTVRRMRQAWKWETWFGLSLFRPSRQSNISTKKDSNIPFPGRTRSVKCPTPGPTKTIKSLPHALPPTPLYLYCWDDVRTILSFKYSLNPEMGSNVSL